MNIHANSIIEDGAKLGKNVTVGPYCHIGSNVELGDDAVLHSHVVIAGHTKIDSGARIFPFASIGHEPQDLKFSGEKTTLIIGANSVIREGVTMNPGTEGDAGNTTIGDNCVFLANSHVAHDCQIGNGVILSNNVMVAGHCKLGDHVIMGGGSAIHQFCRIGDNAFVGGLAGVENDVIPFGLALGNRAYLGGLNLVGMKRAGISRDSIHKARRAFKELFDEGGRLSENTQRVGETYPDEPLVQQIVSFIRDGGERAFCTPKS